MGKPWGLWQDPVGDQQRQHGNAEDELHLVPVRHAVGDGGRHQAPEGKVHVGHAAENGFDL